MQGVHCLRVCVLTALSLNVTKLHTEVALILSLHKPLPATTKRTGLCSLGVHVVAGDLPRPHSFALRNVRNPLLIGRHERRNGGRVSGVEPSLSFGVTQNTFVASSRFTELTRSRKGSNACERLVL